MIKEKEKRICLKCGKQWDIITNNKPKTIRKQCFCKECSKNLSIWDRKVIKMNNDESIRNEYLNNKRLEFQKHYIKQILHRTKRRAELKGLEFSLKEEDIIIPSMCKLLEIPLKIGIKNNYENSPSIDRIDNNKGYTKDNIQIISKKANSMKNSASYEELIIFCKNILRYSPNNTKSKGIEFRDKEL